MEFIAGVLLLLFLIVLGIVWSVYNSLTRLGAMVDEGWSGVDVQLQRRYSLVPNLVDTVKAYAAKEQAILEKVTELRSNAMNNSSRKEVISQNIELGENLSNLMIHVEAYPDIKSNNNFIEIQKQFYDIEDAIQLSRRYYNGTVRNYNIALHVVPNTFFAGLFGFKDRAYFEADESAKQDVKVTL